MHEKIIILDFGGQYAHLIASRIRRLNVLAEIHEPENVSVEFMKKGNVKGLVLSGGPQSVFDEESPRCDTALFDAGIPVLGICYGHQFLTHSLGGEVVRGKKGEFGRAELSHNGNCPLFEGVPQKSIFWMNHVDEVETLAPGFESAGSTEVCRNAALWHPEKNLFAVQFHLEVTHSEYGQKVFENFLNICDVRGDWTIEKFFEEETEILKKQIGDKNVFLFVSGGVDSSVCFAFLTKILGADRVRGLFVDTGLLREGEVEFVKKIFTKYWR